MHQRFRPHTKQDRSEHEGCRHVRTPFAFSFTQVIRCFRLYGRRLSVTKFAFPKQHKEPLKNASYIRNAVARFNQVKSVTEVERRAAWKRIEPAAKRYGVEREESD
jgi:hypothetical protein